MIKDYNIKNSTLVPNYTDTPMLHCNKLERLLRRYKEPESALVHDYVTVTTIESALVQDYLAAIRTDDTISIATRLLRHNKDDIITVAT